MAEKEKAAMGIDKMLIQDNSYRKDRFSRTEMASDSNQDASQRMQN